MSTNPCNCRSYSFPHQPGGGRCRRSHEGIRFQWPWCRDCGGEDLTAGRYDDMVTCSNCGSEVIDDGRGCDYTIEAFDHEARIAEADFENDRRKEDELLEENKT